MALLTSKFDILRGWPNGSACPEEFKRSANTANVNHKAGTWVKCNADYTIQDVAVVSDGKVLTALIIEGAEEPSDSLVTPSTVSVLLGGGYVVRLENKAADGEMFIKLNLVVGSPVLVKADAGGTHSVVALSGTAPPTVGYVLATNLDGNLGTIDVYIR